MTEVLITITLGFSVVCTVLAYKLGYWKGKVSTIPPTVTRRQHIPKYRPDNLLDPISPASQRLERMLDRKEEEDREEN